MATVTAKGRGMGVLPQLSSGEWSVLNKFEQVGLLGALRLWSHEVAPARKLRSKGYVRFEDDDVINLTPRGVQLLKKREKLTKARLREALKDV